MRLILCFLLLSFQVAGQDSSVVKVIQDLPSQEPFDTSRSYRKVEQEYVYIIGTKDLYDIFGYEISTKYWSFNFADYHILGQQMDNKWVWQTRENKKAFVEIPSTTKFGYVGVKLANSRSGYFHDTLTQADNNIDSAELYTHGHGDCFARFTYSVMHDRYYSAIILVEKNYWGGCRAGGSKAYTISFTMPRNIIQYSKNTILMDKYRDGSED